MIHERTFNRYPENPFILSIETTAEPGAYFLITETTMESTRNILKQEATNTVQNISLFPANRDRFDISRVTLYIMRNDQEDAMSYFYMYHMGKTVAYL